MPNTSAHDPEDLPRTDEATLSPLPQKERTHPPVRKHRESRVLGQQERMRPRGLRKQQQETPELHNADARVRFQRA